MPEAQEPMERKIPVPGVKTICAIQKIKRVAPEDFAETVSAVIFCRKIKKDSRPEARTFQIQNT